MRKGTRAPGGVRKGWQDMTAPGADAKVRAWHSRAAWLAEVAVRAEADGNARAEGSRLAVARVMAAAADGATGRGVALSVETIGERAGVSERTVRRARAWLAGEGLAVEVFRGRHLTRAERAARREAGGYGIRAASVWALSQVTAAHPHGVSRGGSLTSEESPKSATRGAKSKPTTTKPRAPRGLQTQRLAAGLAREVRGLDNGTHLGALADGLTRALGSRLGSWSVADVVAATADGRTFAAGEARSPFGYLLARLRGALAGGALSSVERSAAGVAERTERQARQRAEREAEHARQAPPEVVASALASIRATLGAVAVAR